MMSRPALDPIATASTAIIGGPKGRRVDPRASTPNHVIANTVVGLSLGASFLMVIAVVLRHLCRITNWSSPELYNYACYSDIPLVMSSQDYFNTPFPLVASDQPPSSESPGSTMLIWLIARVSPGAAPTALAPAFDTAAIVITAFAVAGVAAAVRLSGTDARGAAWFALSPILAVSSLISMDLLGVVAVLWALVALRSGKGLLAGIGLGLGAIVVPLMWTAIIAVAIVMTRRSFDRPHLSAAVVGTVLAGGMNVAFAVLNPDAFSAWWGKFTTTTVGYGSPWFVSYLLDDGIGGELPLATRLLSTCIIVGAVVVWAMRSRFEVPVETLITVLMVALFLTSPEVPVQSALWLLPFAALAVRLSSIMLFYSVSEVLYSAMTWQYVYNLSEPNRGAPAWAYAAAIMIRVGAWMAVATYAALRAGASPTDDDDQEGAELGISDEDRYTQTVASSESSDAGAMHNPPVAERP